MVSVVPIAPLAPPGAMNESGGASYLAKTNNLSDLTSPAQARANLGIPTAVSSSAMTTWINSLPTSPQVAPGWWNNSGIPTYS